MLKSLTNSIQPVLDVDNKFSFTIQVPIGFPYLVSWTLDASGGDVADAGFTVRVINVIGSGAGDPIYATALTFQGVIDNPPPPPPTAALPQVTFQAVFSDNPVEQQGFYAIPIIDNNA